MKILIVDTYYPAFLRSHETARRDLRDARYSEQRDALLRRRFGTSDFYSRNLRALGHEAEEIIANASEPQRAWAREHGRRTFRLGSRLEQRRLRHLLVEQVRTLAPDIVYVQDVPWLGRAAERVWEHTRLLVGQHATVPPPADLLRPYDLLISSLPNLVEWLRSQGADSEYLPLAFESSLLDEVPSSPPAEVVHVGGYGPIHAERNQLLERVAGELPLDCWGYGVEALPAGSPIRRVYRGEAWGLEMYAVRAAARVTLTKHIGAVAGTHANSASLFEATGVGSCLVVDERSDIERLFEPDREVATYRDADDCAEVIRHLLADEPRRTGLAAAGQARTLREHTWTRRMAELSALLSERLERRRR